MPENWFVFADCFDNGQVICVDNAHNLIMFDDKFEISKKLDLFKNAHLFDLSAKFVDKETGLTLL